MTKDFSKWKKKTDNVWKKGQYQKEKIVKKVFITKSKVCKWLKTKIFIGFFCDFQIVIQKVKL